MRTIRRALLVIAMLSAAALAQTQEASGGWTVRLRFPDNVDTTNLQIVYQLKSVAGGAYGNDARIPPGAREYVVEASFGRQKQPALAFQAIIYCPGYRVVLVNEAPPAGGSRVTSISLNLRPLERTQLTGVWASAPPNVADFDLEVVYLAPWSHGFFGIWDGAVTSFKAAAGKFGRDGTFALEVPDLSRDPVVNSYETRGELQLHARERKTGNTPYSLEELLTTGRSISIPVDKPLPTDLMLVGVVR